MTFCHACPYKDNELVLEIENNIKIINSGLSKTSIHVHFLTY